MWQVELRRLASGLPMAEVVTGNAYAKALYPDQRASGRLATWPTLVWLTRTVFIGPNKSMSVDEADAEFLDAVLQDQRPPRTMTELRMFLALVDAHIAGDANPAFAMDRAIRRRRGTHGPARG
jgi:hypothetical protein